MIRAVAPRRNAITGLMRGCGDRQEATPRPVEGDRDRASARQTRESSTPSVRVDRTAAAQGRRDLVEDAMSRTRLTTIALIVFVWASMMAFGGVAAETVMLYPNIFGDAPASLDRARDFLVDGGPSDYFPPLGAMTVLAAAASVVLTWRVRRIRWFVVAATGVFVACDFLFSVLFFWPRNDIMFVDPPGTHTAEYLRQVAEEFVAGHSVRLVGGAVTSALAFTALLVWVRDNARTPVAADAVP
ncbi:DUF1772 domain-containing protein [Asanoa sp. WMMD1127]|uniref:DUF1772 domain-containing protein n=1 Tax=Asanoa sp. WMMD1127 TaxID=3016107 RepID=UPI0024177372|nr:DUF1772 domain-containing protein [Asanoa sp. WMMD1127]MDG4825072.1 DUF1772 domain-containing protein [Asanoa sp. WMMD1127]